MRYTEAIEILFGLESFGVKLGLHNIRRLADRLGNPQDRIRTIHVAGTNGKGTVCSTLAAVLQAAGYKTGLFTSPHLVDYRERIRVDGQRIPRREVVRFMRTHGDFITEHKITFFETATAMAFDHFHRSECDVAVFEVGLGGRLDATNVLTPELSVITSIDFDHTKSLGRTRRKIAREKAGIVKPGVPVVCSPMAPAALDAIFRIARAHRAPFIDAGQTVALNNLGTPHRRLIDTRGKFPNKIDWSYPGRVHEDNLRTVIAALMCLRRDGFCLSDTAIKRGLAETRWPGRFQQRRGKPRMIFDVAHNAAAARGLADSLKDIAADTYLSAVCAVANDKRWDKMIGSLAPLVDRWYFTRFPNRRSWRITEVSACARKLGLSFTRSKNPNVMLARARAETPRDGIVLVFGSHYLVGHLLPPSAVDPAPLAR